MSEEKSSFMRRLPVTLSEKEKVDRGRSLAGKLIERGEVDTEFAGVKSTFKGKLEGIDAEVGRLQNIVNDGREYRDVECVQQEDWADQRVTVVRTDTGEEVEARPMTLEERQRLPFGREM